VSVDVVETERCDVCGERIPLNRVALHARGIDGARPECPKQDIVEIAMRARRTWNGNEWDAMRQRLQEVRPR
jgi:hypothetical protein